MTAEVVPLPERFPTPKVVEVVNDVRESLRMPDARELAIERCADQIARAMGRLTLEQRIGLERALDALVDEVQWHKRDPWC